MGRGGNHTKKIEKSRVTAASWTTTAAAAQVGAAAVSPKEQQQQQPQAAVTGVPLSFLCQVLLWCWKEVVVVLTQPGGSKGDGVSHGERVGTGVA